MTNETPGDRLSKNCQVVLDVVRAQGPGRHASTSDIFSEARRRQPRIGYSTVYRALARLQRLGLVAEVRIPGAASALYEPVGANHAHFVCDECGRVDDFDYTPSAALMGEIAEGQGVEVTSLSITVHGVCADCRAREARSAEA